MMTKISEFKNVILILLLNIPVASAATITVNNNQDAGTNCTFREAVQEINLGSSNETDCISTGTFGVNDLIEFASNVNTVALTQGEIVISRSVEINGNDNLTSIIGNGTSRLLNN